MRDFDQVRKAIEKTDREVDNVTAASPVVVARRHLYHALRSEMARAQRAVDDSEVCKLCVRLRLKVVIDAPDDILASSMQLTAKAAVKGTECFLEAIGRDVSDDVFLDLVGEVLSQASIDLG